MGRIENNEDEVVEISKELPPRSLNGMRWIKDKRIWINKKGPAGTKMSLAKESEVVNSKIINKLTKKGIYSRIEKLWTPEKRD